MSKNRILVAASLLLLTAGAALISFGLAAGSAGPRAGSSPAFVESAACADCPAGLSLDAVEVQAVSGGTLFTVRGALPGSADRLSSAVRLVANDVQLVLNPYGRQDLFEVVQATRAGQPLAAGSVAASLRSGILLIDLERGLLQPPLRFELGFWTGSAYAGRLPRKGTLGWEGSGAPRLQAAEPTPVQLDPAVLARTCTAIPSGTVPPYLNLGQLSTRSEADPRTSQPSRALNAALAASPVGINERYAIAAILAHAGSAPASGSGAPIDRAGDVQLWVWNDGSARHKAIRSRGAAGWTVLADAAAEALTYRLSPAQVSFFWTGLQASDRFGFVSAAPGGCSASGLDANLVPRQAAG